VYACSNKRALFSCQNIQECDCTRIPESFDTKTGHASERKDPQFWYKIYSYTDIGVISYID
jgi:hypothetical protein